MGAILGFIIGELLLIFFGLITVISPFLGKSSVLPIVNVESFAFISDWFITCLSCIRLGKTAPHLNRHYKVKHKICLYSGALMAGLLIIFMILPGSSAQLKWPLEYIILTV